MPCTVLLDLPAEIIQQILEYVTPEDACAVGRGNKHLYAISSTPTLWAYYHRRHYRYGNIFPHNEGVDQNALENAKDAFGRRRRLDLDVYRLFNDILRSTKARNKKIEQIALFGLNAKDAILSLMGDTENLSHNFWANAVLGRIHRSLGIASWVTKEPIFELPKLAEVLAAFDLFVLEGQDDRDFHAIGAELKRLGAILRDEHPKLMSESVENRANIVAEFLRTREFVGVLDDEDYHNLRNNFIGLALFDQHHEGLPLICTAIYCCLAQTVGLNAHPCSFPYHVYVTITGGKRQVQSFEHPAESDSYIIDEELETPLYIDAFRPGQKVLRSHLETLLREMNAAQSSYELFLGPASPVDMVLRTGQNIVRSIQLIHHSNGQPLDPRVPPRWATVAPDPDMAFYAALFASILLGTQAREGDPIPITTRRRRYLPYLLEHFKVHCPWDLGLIGHHILPLFQSLPEYQSLRDVVRQSMIEDANDPPITPRGRRELEKVQYYVGQVFRHKRYGYLAVIKGWNVECQAGEEWIRQMNVDALPGGRHQSFYHVLVEDKSDRYVAAENIEITEEHPSAALLKIAGRYFHRYDKATKRFISNMKEEYPDD